MKTNPLTKLLALLFAMALIAAACGGSDSDDTEASSDDSSESSDSSDESSDDGDDAMEDGDEAMEDGDEAAGGVLADVCPANIVIQTDWFPEAEHGAMYEMIGDDYVVDAENKTTSGSLVAGGVDTGVDIEVRAGGPAIGFAAPRVQAYTDDSIVLAYSSLDAQVLAWDDAPMLTVMAPLEINPQMIMWDADTYPDVESIADLGEAGVTINVFGGGGFSDIFVAQGIWSADQVDPSYDGSPARFVADNTIAQQGFASAEPYNYENVFEDYGKAPAFQLLHDAGFQTYSQTLAIRPDDLETLRPCLELLVPIAQQAVVDFSSNPDRTNAMIVDVVATFDDFWVYSEGLAAYGVATMTELGLHGNGPDSTVGNLDLDRVQGIIDQVADAGLPVPDGVSVDAMVTNEFIDESIGF